MHGSTPNDDLSLLLPFLAPLAFTSEATGKKNKICSTFAVEANIFPFNYLHTHKYISLAGMKVIDIRSVVSEAF